MFSMEMTHNHCSVWPLPNHLWKSGWYLGFWISFRSSVRFWKISIVIFEKVYGGLRSTKFLSEPWKQTELTMLSDAKKFVWEGFIYLFFLCEIDFLTTLSQLFIFSSNYFLQSHCELSSKTLLLLFAQAKGMHTFVFMQ